ncbi:MAG: hypothetical protein GXY74_05475 [Phycisphaerae bacterium]|nr:hypothetical protein [Phycisphaerae bacterium]
MKADHNADAMTQARRWLDAGWLALPDDILAEWDDATRRVAGLCLALTMQSPDGEFYLSERAATTFAGLDARFNSYRLGLLQVLGLLIQTEPGRGNRPARYRWMGRA